MQALLRQQQGSSRETVARGSSRPGERT